MHEDEEDEPENTYEMLEKKRQREIEVEMSFCFFWIMFVIAASGALTSF